MQFHVKQNSDWFSSQATWTQKYIEWVSEILPNIRDIFENKFVVYLDNDAKHVSVETLKWYSRCEIEIETGPPHSPDINLIENIRGIIKKKLKGHEFKYVDELKTHVKSIYDEISISAIQNWVDNIKTVTKENLQLMRSI